MIGKPSKYAGLILALSTSFATQSMAAESVRYFLKMPYQGSSGVDLQFSHEINKRQAKRRNHFKVTYDYQGRIASAFFQLGDTLRSSNHASNRQFHAAGLHITYEADKEVRSFFNAAGERTAVMGDVWQITYQLQPETGLRVHQKNEDPSGQAVNSNRGFATQTFTHFEDGSLIEERFDLEGKPVWIRPDWSIYKARFAYKDNGLLSSMTEIEGENRKAIYTFDRRGAHASTSWFNDLTGSPIIGPQGVFRLYRHNTPEGYFSGFDFVDLAGQPAAYKGNIYFIREFEHDRFGNTIHMRTFGADGSPALEQAGYHHVKYTFDETGLQRTQAHLYGTDGQPIQGSAGFSRIEYRYDANGKADGRTYYNLAGETVTPNAN